MTTTEAPVKPPPTIETIVERYIKLRDLKAEKDKAHKESLKEIDEALERLENHLLKTMQAQGADGIKTPSGTAYITTKSSATIGDKDLFKHFLATQEDPYTFLDMKANKPAIEAYKTEHQDLPPGVNWSEIMAVNVRRK